MFKDFLCTMLITHFMIFLLFRWRVLHGFPTKCLFHLIGREHLSKHISVYGNVTFNDYPSFLSILASSPLTVTVEDTVVNATKTRPAAYLFFIPIGDGNEAVVDQAQDTLRQLSTYSYGWFPSTTVIIVVLTEKDENELIMCKTDMVSKLVLNLWKYKVYNSVIFIAKENDENGEAWTSSPFEKDNFCGKKVRVINCSDCSAIEKGGGLVFGRTSSPVDLSGCVFRVSTRESPPFAFKIADKNDGADVNFVRLFAEVTHALVEWQERPSPESGVKSSVALAYYQQISNGFIDLAIGGAVLRAEFDSKVHYLTPHGEHLLKIYVSDGDIISGWSSIYCMFSWKLWLMVFLTVFIAGGILHLLEFLRQLFAKGKHHFSGGEIFLVVLAILFEQTSWKTPHYSLSHRLLLGTLCVGFLLTSSLYKIFLQSYTVRPPIASHVRTFDDLIEFNYSVAVSDTNMNALKDSNVSRLKRIKSWKSSTLGSLKTLENLNSKRNFAFLERDCFVEYLLRNGTLRIHALEGNEIDSLSVSMVMPKGSEYTEKVETLLTRTIESGIYGKWMSDIVGWNHAQVPFEPRTLGLVDLWAVFILLIIGNFLAFLVLFAEIVVHRLRTEWDLKESKRLVQRRTKGRPFIWLN